MRDVTRLAREFAGRLTPAGRRWRHHLRSLPIDPDQRPASLVPPGNNDFILCGSPRTGTTMLAGMLWQPPRVVTVMEPWDGMRIWPGELFASLREEIADQAALGRGRLDVAALEESGVVSWTPEGASRVRLALDEDYSLGVKWPAFWRFLPHLPDTKFLVTVRDPIEVIESYRTASRQLAAGQEYATRFNRAMNAQVRRAHGDPARRRIAMFDYIHERLLPHLDRPNVLTVRYERWFHDREQSMAEIGAFLGVELGSGLVKLREPRSRQPDPATVALVRRHCRTAAALGYAL